MLVQMFWIMFESAMYQLSTPYTFICNKKNVPGHFHMIYLFCLVIKKIDPFFFFVHLCRNTKC